MEIGTFNKKVISQGDVKNVTINQFGEEQKRINTEFVNTVSKSKSVTLDLSQFLESYDNNMVNNQQVNMDQNIETLFDNNINQR